jgi:hypothetical protein
MFNLGDKVRMKYGGLEGIVIARYPMAKMSTVEFSHSPAFRHVSDDVELEPIPGDEEDEETILSRRLRNFMR